MPQNTLTDLSNLHHVTKPIGVFDSGVGGLSVLSAIGSTAPQLPCIYMADSGHAPYGSRSASYVEQRCTQMINFLLTHEVQGIVIACNTATVLAAQALRQWCPVPIIAMEPAIKPAAIGSRTGVVGVLATEQTIASPNVAKLCAQWGQQARIVLQACPGLVECVEQGQLDAPHTQQLVEHYLQPLLDQGVDTVVLGCTHYPFLRPLLQRVAGEHIHFIDPAAAVARELVRRLDLKTTGAASTNPAQYTFYSSGALPQAQTVMQSLWGQNLAVKPFLA